MLSAIKHQFFDCLRLVGLRDRLRCPDCGKVGTWKPHGGWLDGEDERRVRRWLCKWCGYYVGPEGVQRAFLGNRAWTINVTDSPAELPLFPDSGQRCTPADFVGFSDPWRG